MRPVGSELEFHRNAGDDAEDEADAEDLRPESRGLVVPLIVLPETDALQRNDQRSQSHGQLWKQVMEGNRECEMQSMY